MFEGRVLLTLIACVAFVSALDASPMEPPEPSFGGWTEREILAARPLPMPEIARIPEVPHGGSRTRTSTGSGGSRAAPPRLSAPAARARSLADSARLRAAWPGAERQRGSVLGKNRGTVEFDFSSSRLIPGDAGTTYPYSTVGVLFFRRPGVGSFLCSASVVSKRLIATAGHCLYNGAAGFSTDLLFVPAFDQGVAPLGTWDGVEIFVSEEWLDQPEVPSSADFGVVVLADSGGMAVGDVTGWLGYKTGALEDNHVKMLGYPGNLDGAQRMHQVDSGDSFLFDDPIGVVYGSDMREGSSGGPWVQNFGVKAKGQNGGRNKAVNRIVGITSALFSDKKLLMLESSVLGPSFKKIFNQACDQAAGNCAKRGKPDS